MPLESIFTYGAPGLKFGEGAVDELGPDLRRMGARRVLVVTDAGVAATGLPERVAAGLRTCGIDATVFDGVHVEPTDESLVRAGEAAASSGPWDAFIAVGGGSAIDTAKAMNLLVSCPGELMDYVNAPVGGGRTPEGPLKPLVAVPTTTGTGSESTTVCVLDVLSMKVKTGISHAALRPTLAVVDPDVMMSQPPEVTACAGMDILCHALESYTAKPFTGFERKQADRRVPYCGANPLADVFADRAMALLGPAFRTAVRDGGNRQARHDMALAATFAGLGFGNAGVHIPHANGYPIAGRVRDFRPSGYPREEPMVPHGMSVCLTAPEAFRFTYPTDPGRHERAAALLDPAAAEAAEGAERLPAVLAALMRDIGIPNGIAGVGYGEADVPALVDGAMAQQRLLAIAPRPVGADDLDGIFRRSLANW
ncbi:MAG: hydroxyacid-oxoacid transhydrogenase [Candidatus Nanopelagicales bacterium]